MSDKAQAQYKGFGDPSAFFNIYIANSPNYTFASKTLDDDILTFEDNDIYDCGQACGNGWRKVFNVYAKLIFALSMPTITTTNRYQTWQHYRDKCLLQKSSNTALLLSPPLLDNNTSIHVIMGKHYASTLLDKGHLGNPDNIHWLTSEFAINTCQPIIICPYFDYRQLSNAKIIYLVALINDQYAKYYSHIPR